MTRSCLGYPGHRCGRLIPSGNRCGDCQRGAWRHWNARRNPVARSVYRSNVWKELARRVVVSAAGCFYCGRSDVQLTADHVVSIRVDPSRATDETNLVPACRSCQEKRKHDPTWWGVAPRREPMQ
jgi:5-methylcytosine-specific restriction endonuclease McrA